MIYTAQEVFDFVKEEDVKFIRLAFCDTLGRQKNISILPSELRRAFEDGISFDASAICGFGGAEKSDLLLFPDPSTLNILPWRPSHGKVVRMFCDIRHPDGTPFACAAPLPMQRRQASRCSSVRKLSSICSKRMKTATRRRSRLTMRPTWMLHPKTRAKTCVARSA